MDAEDLVNINYQKIASLKEEADRKEHELELERIRTEHNRKVKKIINEKVDFPKSRAFKRQNSYDPLLEEFGDIDDADALKRNMGKMRRSIDPNKKRTALLPRIEDRCKHRLNNTPLNVSVTESVGTGMPGMNTGYGGNRTGGSWVHNQNHQGHGAGSPFGH